MKPKLVLLAVLALAAAFIVGRQLPAPAPAGDASPTGSPSAQYPAPRAPRAGAEAAGDGSLRRAIDARAYEAPVTGRGTVVKLLRDDNEGSPHQRILLRVDGGGTVLIAHNIALAARVAPLAVGDELEFAGDYVWNEKGGVVHWTHSDPQGRHRAGWIRRVGR